MPFDERGQGTNAPISPAPDKPPRVASAPRRVSVPRTNPQAPEIKHQKLPDGMPTWDEFFASHGPTTGPDLNPANVQATRDSLTAAAQRLGIAPPEFAQRYGLLAQSGEVSIENPMASEGFILPGLLPPAGLQMPDGSYGPSPVTEPGIPEGYKGGKTGPHGERLPEGHPPSMPTAM